MEETKTYYTKDILKLVLAQQLGYGEKIMRAGWGELTSAESGDWAVWYMVICESISGVD